MITNIVEIDPRVNLVNTLRVLNNQNALSVAAENYSDKRFAELSYTLSSSTFVQSLDANKSADDGDCIYGNFGKCIIKSTSLRYPRKYNFVKEFEYYSGAYRLAGMKTFSVELLEEMNFEYVLQVLLRRIVEKKSTKGREATFIIALYWENASQWEIAVINKVIKSPLLSNGEKMLSMGQDYYMVVKFFDPQYLLNGMESNSEVHYIKL